MSSPDCSNDDEFYYDEWESKQPMLFYVKKRFGLKFLCGGCEVCTKDFQEDIRDLCKTYRLPMFQLWGFERLLWSRNVNQNEFCILYPLWTISRVINPGLLDELSKRWLWIKDLGVFGKAYARKEPWFSSEMSSIRNIAYPLSDHARMLGLRSTVSIPFLFTYEEEEYSYAFDFFLPSDCTDIEEQRKIVKALISTDLPQLLKKYMANGFHSGCRFVLEPLNEIERSGSSEINDETTNISTSVNDGDRSIIITACNLTNTPDGSSDDKYSDDDWVLEVAEFFQQADIFKLPSFIEEIKEICKTKRLSMVKLWYLNRLPWPSDVNQNGSCLYPVWNFTQGKFFSYAKLFRSTFFHDFCNRPLMEGQGLAGKACATNQPWFSTDVSSIPNADYPLSVHARMLGLRSAVSIPFLLTYGSSMEYPVVFEFFLPSNCTDCEEQMKIVKTLISTDLPQLFNEAEGCDHYQLDYGCKLEDLKEFKSGPNDSLSPNENPREASDGIRSSLEPGDQNAKNVELTEVGDTIGRGSCLSPAVNEISEQRPATGDKAINISTSVNDAATSTIGGKRTGGVRKKRDWAWKYCSEIKGNSNGVRCDYCKLEFKGGGITRFKSHISGSDTSKNVKKCEKVPSDIKAEIEKRIKRGKQKKMTPKPTIIS